MTGPEPGRANDQRLLVELRGERARSALALEAGQLGDWELDLRTQSSPVRSRRHDQIFGYTAPRRDWSLDIFLEHVHPDDRDSVRRAFEAALERGAPWDFECRIHRADGALRWIWARGVIHRADDGSPERMLGVVADVTSRKQTEQSLRGLAAAAVELHAASDEGEMLELVTRRARELIGADEAVTRLVPGRAHGDGGVRSGSADRVARVGEADATQGDEVERRVMETNRPLRVPRRPAAKPGTAAGDDAAESPEEPGWLAAPLVGRNGAIWGLIRLCGRKADDFTEEDEAILVQLAHMAASALENRRLVEDAQQANRAKAEFLAAMSHELRTPLNAVGGYVELLDMEIHGPLTEAQKRALGRVAANQRHLLTLINDILSFARLEAGRIEFRLDVISVPELLSSMEPLVSPQAEAKGVAYGVERCDPELCFRGDAERVRQILLNLIGNAVKFTAEGGRVSLSCRDTGEWVEICVSDDGVGIPPDQLERIFEPFQQLGRRLNRPGEGVGLGLAISRDLARAMGGELAVESTPGAGSSFALRLPSV